MMGHNKEHIKFLDTNAECRVHVCAVESVADIICKAVPSNIEKSVKNRAAHVNRISPQVLTELKVKSTSRIQITQIQMPRKKIHCLVVNLSSKR